MFWATYVKFGITTQVHGSTVHGWRVMKIESRLAGKILWPGKWHAN